MPTPLPTPLLFAWQWVVVTATSSHHARPEYQAVMMRTLTVSLRELAGSETTSSTMISLLHCLGGKPEWQDLIVKELHEAGGCWLCLGYGDRASSVLVQWAGDWELLQYMHPH
jgi:hypothetical protein